MSIFTCLRKALHESRLFIFIIQKSCQKLEIIGFSIKNNKKKKNCQTSIRCLPLENSFWAFSVVCADLYFNMLKHKKEGQHIQLHISVLILTVNMWSGTDLYNIYIGKKWLLHMPWTVMLQLNLTHQNFYLVSGFSLGPEFQESLTLRPKFSRVKMKFPRAQKIIKGQNYLVYMDRDGWKNSYFPFIMFFI